VRKIDPGVKLAISNVGATNATETFDVNLAAANSSCR